MPSLKQLLVSLLLQQHSWLSYRCHFSLTTMAFLIAYNLFQLELIAVEVALQ